MKHFSMLLVLLCPLTLMVGCKSKSKEGIKQPDEPIFGIYYFKVASTVLVELKQDSTAVMDIHNTALENKKGPPATRYHGRFTYRNDSIFIDWEHGGQVKSPFEKKPASYSFRIGSSQYEKKIK